MLNISSREQSQLGLRRDTEHIITSLQLQSETEQISSLSRHGGPSSLVSYTSYCSSIPRLQALRSLVWVPMEFCEYTNQVDKKEKF